MHSECWISMRFSFSRCLLCSKLFNKSQLQCNICYVLCVLAWNCHYSECIIDWCVWWRHAIPATFMYSSGDLLLFEFRFIIIGFAAYYFSWKYLMHWTVPLKCWREIYFYLTFVHNIIWHFMLVQTKYVPLIFLRAYKAAEWRVNKLKDNIEMDIQENALMTMWNESSLINKKYWNHHYQPRCLVENDEYLGQFN